MLGPPLLPRNLEASIRDLSSTKAEVRASAVEDLVRHARGDDATRTRAIPLLTQRLTDDHARVRAASAVALGDLEASESVTALLIAVEDENPHVRQMVLNALGEIGDARALPRLRRALKDSRPEVRYQSIIAFARVADHRQKDDSTPTSMEASTTRDTSEVDDALFEAATDEDEAIAHIALRVAEERLDAGHLPDGRLLARARSLIATSGSSDATSSPHVMLVAAILLAKAGDERGHDIVLRVVQNEKIGGQTPDKEDERAAVELAGELGLRKAIPHLEKRAYGVMRFVRDTCPFHARIALARMGHDRAKSEIMTELSSNRKEVLSGAVVSAGRARMIEAKDVITKLTAAAVDPELTREALARLEAPLPEKNAATKAKKDKEDDGQEHQEKSEKEKKDKLT